MSFLRRNLASYPQPVLVTPDPKESLPDAVAEAIESSQVESRPNVNSVVEPSQTRDGHQSPVPSQDSIQPHQHKDNTKIADGIMSLLGPVVQEMDFNIVSVRKSQAELEREIERLLAELQLFMSSAAAPPEVEPAMQKLLKARRQIMGANTTLRTVQDRVDRMCATIERRH
ncbi:hypothetical protein BGZ94_000867 [Podila epigama]|nr:hypothetical protein BGZ94_000867 [Podila epigama]